MDQCPAPPPQVLWSFSFTWAGAEFANDCWHALGVRLDLTDEQMINRDVKREGKSATLRVYFGAYLSANDRADVMEGLHSGKRAELGVVMLSIMAFFPSCFRCAASVLVWSLLAEQRSREFRFVTNQFVLGWSSSLLFFQ